MGYIRHHAIAITSCDEKKIKKAHKKAKKIFNQEISNILISGINGYFSFFVQSDGSNEGWGESDIGDLQRKQFVDWINKQAYEDGSNCISFCEFYYGDNKGKSKIVNHN